MDEQKQLLCHDPHDITIELDDDIIILKAYIDEHDIIERNNKIVKISNDVTILSDLFNDLNSLVNDQWDVIDKVAENIESCGENVQIANEELTQAVKLNNTNKLFTTGLIASCLILPVGALLGAKYALVVATGGGLITYKIYGV